MVSEVKPLLEEIERRAEAESKRIIEEARAEAQKIISSAEAKSAELLKATFEPEALARRRRILSTSELEGRRKLIKTKDELVSQVFQKAFEQLKKMAEEGGNKYYEFLYNLILEAAREIGEETLVAKVNQRDYQYTNSNLKSIEERLSKDLGMKVKLKLSEEKYDGVGGVILGNEDGSKTYYNTIEGRIRRLEDTLRIQVGKILFMEE